MKWLSDATLVHLCSLDDGSNLPGTRYELLEQIGQGGMGTVYRALDRKLDREVALKVLRLADPAAMARFANEARIIARLEHPSIIPVHDCGLLPDGRFYYAMKLVRGKRLDARIEELPSLTERLQLFQKICDAAAFAHAHGVIHRDLKPQNIMIGAFGEALVMDWGVAKVIGGFEKLPSGTVGSSLASDTAHGTVVGTPAYMAPEQARGEIALVDERADVYALGAILYFVLASRAPTHTVGSEALVSPRQLDRSIPRPIEAVCLKAMAEAPAGRYPTAASLAGEIADFLAGRRVGAYPERPLETAIRLGTRYRTVLTLILAYVVIRVVLLIFTG